MTPHWQLQHDWKIEDIRDTLNDIWEFKKLLLQHPDDFAGDSLRGAIKELKKCLERQRRAYEKIYGDKPNTAQLRREVERGGV